MAILFRIPIIYKEGNYGVKDFGMKDLDEDFADSIAFDYDAQYQILEYDVPVGSEDDRYHMRLYQVPAEQILKTLRAFYDSDGQLQKIKACLYEPDKEALMYIHYADPEEARQKIKAFAIQNADSIAELLCSTCTETVSRLFVEYFWDGEAIDFHALVGTPAQKEDIKKKYPDSDTAVDNSGDYSSPRIFGDNHTFAVMISCADQDAFDFFGYAIDIMSERVREQCVDRLQKSEDFKFISDAYD